jgi:hypothetical protein
MASHDDDRTPGQVARAARPTALDRLDHRPSPAPRREPMSLRSAAGGPDLLDLIDQDPVWAGGQLWGRADAEATPIGWGLAQECGVPLAGHLRELWALEMQRAALVAELATL